jgi:hypothetical protein
MTRVRSAIPKLKAQCDILALKLMTRSQSLNRSTSDPFRDHHRRGGAASLGWLQ